MRTVLVMTLAFAVGCRTTAGKVIGSMTGATYVAGVAVVMSSPEGSRRFDEGMLLLGLTLALGGVLYGVEHPHDELASAPLATGGPAMGVTTVTAAGSSEARQPAGGYDVSGTYAGRRDALGNYYDESGAPNGRVDPDGSYYDASGAAAGRHDANGNVYDRSGAPAGRVDAHGNLYDVSGAFAGRVDASGNIYDRDGASAGRLDGPCDDACLRDAAGRILLAIPE